MKDNLINKIKSKEFIVGIIGLGYVGLPLAREFLTSGFHVTGFDVDSDKVEKINRGKSYIKHISNDFLKKYVNKAMLKATDDFSEIKDVDAVIICVPTPLGEHYEPELKYIKSTALEIKNYLKRGHLIVLESTTYPGTTDGELLPLLQESDLVAGKDFFLGYSPEREDPGNKDYTTRQIPKIVSGITKDCCDLINILYSQVFDKVVPVSSPRVAESAKLLENIYRSVNIALVNELKIIFGRMDIDIWEVIEAAKTKPFGFQAFYPGPGLGGHCIPIDPFYLTWKAREYEVHTRFIELAGEINTNMPSFILNTTVKALNSRSKPIKGSNVLVLGLAYKKDVDDTRESPSLRLIDLMMSEGANVQYNDPYIPQFPITRKYRFDMGSVELTPSSLKNYDVVIIATDHSTYDYEMIRENAGLIVDTRNAMGQRGIVSEKIWKA